MFHYYEALRRRHDLPVLPIGVYLQVGLDGIGWDSYEEHFWGHRLVRFDYPYVGLPALDAEQYVRQENWLGVALSALMRVPKERKKKLAGEANQRPDARPPFTESAGCRVSGPAPHKRTVDAGQTIRN